MTYEIREATRADREALGRHRIAIGDGRLFAHQVFVARAALSWRAAYRRAMRRWFRDEYVL
jgi:hypothetical protein